MEEFGACSVNRADSALTLDLQEVGIPCSPWQMVRLIKRGNIPEHFAERKTYSEKSHRMKADPNSLYLESKSVGINFYWKYAKISPKHPLYPNRDQYYHIIRLEVQNKYPALYSIAKNTKGTSKYVKSPDELSIDELEEMIIMGIHFPSIPVDTMLADRVSTNVIRKNIHRILRKGDYLTLHCACWMAEKHNFRHKKEARLIFALESVSQHKGIAGAMANLKGKDLKDFKRSLKDLDDLLINPVTIPRKWEITHIPNPLHAYYSAVSEEQFTTMPELKFEELLRAYTKS